jgi:hypothetical protein
MWCRIGGGIHLELLLGSSHHTASSTWGAPTDRPFAYRSLSTLFDNIDIMEGSKEGNLLPDEACTHTTPTPHSYSAHTAELNETNAIIDAIATLVDRETSVTLTS